jgi:hypothetical protein
MKSKVPLLAILLICTVSLFAPLPATAARQPRIFQQYLTQPEPPPFPVPSAWGIFWDRLDPGALYIIEYKTDGGPWQPSYAIPCPADADPEGYMGAFLSQGFLPPNFRMLRVFNSGPPAVMLVPPQIQFLPVSRTLPNGGRVWFQNEAAREQFEQQFPFLL